MGNNLSELMGVTLEKIKQMVDVNTIIGEAITSPDGSIIIPVSKVSYGLASGGSDFSSKKSESKDLFGGGSTAGVTISPVAFIAISNGEIKLLELGQNNTPADKAIELIPEVVDKISSMVKKNNDKKKKTEVDLDIEL